MPNYAFAYFGEPQFATQEEASAEYAKFQAWLNGLGESVVNPGTPLGVPKIVKLNGVTDGAKPTRLTGFSIVKADNIDAAVEMAKNCPFLKGGTIEVSEVLGM